MAISRKTWYGIAREATPLTPMTAPTMYLPAKGVIKFERKPEYSTEERGTRDTNYQVQYTTRKAAADLKGNFYCDSSVYLFLGALGGIASAQQAATTAYKHTLSLADIPPSFTVFKGFDSQVYQMPGSYVEKLGLKLNADGKLLEIDGSMLGLYPQKYTGSALTPTFGNIKPIAGYAANIAFGSSGILSTDVLDFDMEYSHKLTPWFSASGSPDFSTMYIGERVCKLGFTARFDNTYAMDWFSTSGLTADESVTFDIKGNLIASTYYQELNLAFPTVNFESVEIDLGKDNVLVKVKAMARPSSSNPLLSAFIQNTTTSYTT